MRTLLPVAGSRFRVLSTRLLSRMGFTEESFLLVPAILIGVVAAAAAVAFHEGIVLIRNLLYANADPQFLYGRGIWLLILWPAAGGLAVGLIGRFWGVSHGVADVIESVIKSQGFIRPASAIQRIITSSLTIGTGGSAGAEGPIVQVGAAIASGVGQLFRIARQHMPILVGAGTAAGISAIFNAPIGGVLFTLEIILQDFSIRGFAPLMIASVVANVTTRAIFQGILHDRYSAIFAMPSETLSGLGAGGMLTWTQLPNFAVLGIVCGLVASGLTLLMLRMERIVSRWRTPRALRPALGGASVGVLGVLYVMILGWWMLGAPKPFAFQHYPLPAFFSDGYGVVQDLLRPSYYSSIDARMAVLLLLVLCAIKVLATCLTLATGGSGGIIAPSLFLGAATGGFLGLVLQKLGIFPEVFPAIYALVGMGAVLGAVVHAPLAAILILVELTSDYRIIMPAMIATILAVGMARFIFRESVYTMSLLERGIRTGSTRDVGLLRRMSVEQIGMEPAFMVTADLPFRRLLEMMGECVRDVIVASPDGIYRGMLRRQDIETALLQPDSIPLLVCGEMIRTNISLLKSSDNLAYAMEAFASGDVDTLPVCLPYAPEKIVGVITHQHLVRKYHELLERSR